MNAKRAQLIADALALLGDGLTLHAAMSNRPCGRSSGRDPGRNLEFLARGPKTKASLTRKGVFCRLAAIIYGKPAKDMMTFCVSAKD